MMSKERCGRYTASSFSPGVKLFMLLRKEGVKCTPGLKLEFMHPLQGTHSSTSRFLRNCSGEVLAKLLMLAKPLSTTVVKCVIEKCTPEARLSASTDRTICSIEEVAMR